MVAVARDDRHDGRPRPRRLGAVGAGTGGARPPSPEDHRPVRAGGPADGRRRARGHDRLQRLHLQLPRAARELEAAGYRFFSTGDTEVIVKAYQHWGDSFVEHLTGMFAFCLVERDSGRVVLGRDRLGIKPLYLAEVGGQAALRLDAAGPAGRRRRRHVDRPGRAAPLPDVPLGGARAPHDPAGGAEAAARHAAGRRARRTPARVHLLAHRLRPPPRARGLVGPGLGGRDPVRPAHRRRPAHGGRRARRVPAVGRPRLEPRRRAAGRGRACATCSRSASGSSRTAASRATSSAGPTWSPSGSPPTTTASASAAIASCRRWAAPSRR